MECCLVVCFWVDKRPICCFFLYKKQSGYPDSVISRAILKPVYRFGIPNSNAQMLKSLDFWCKLLSMFLVAEPREQCFELFRMQNSQKFPGFRPWTPLGRAYSATPDSLAAQRHCQTRFCIDHEWNRH